MKPREILEKEPASGISTDTPPQAHRRRGEGRIWRRGRIWWIRYRVNGCRVDESSHSEKEEVAARLLDKRRAEIEADTFVGPAAQRLRYEQMRDALYADYQTNRRKSLMTGTGAT